MATVSKVLEKKGSDILSVSPDTVVFDAIKKMAEISAGTNANGFIGDLTALAVASRLPLNDDEVREAIDFSTVLLPNGVVIQVSKWVSKASRNTWNSLDVVFGAAVGDASAGEVIEDGTA